jgi:leader peptidase (prepilin peptidase)/N-methyltransferase
MWLAYSLLLVFVLGTVVGSFLNVCVARLPLEKSLLWPGSRCGHCLQPIRWYENLPLISYLWLRGRCRTCGQTFSVRYFLIELLTGLGFVGLFYAEVVLNIHRWTAPPRLAFDVRQGVFPWQWWAAFGFHAILFSFLVAASACDLTSREIPLSLTVTGTIIGLAGAVVFAWPFPYTPDQALEPVKAVHGGAPLATWWDLRPENLPKEALYPWPVWGPLPAWLRPGGDWKMGLATGLAGAAAGALVLRAVGFLFGTGLGKEAMGLGDADLMMMAGAFIGWQPVVIAFLVSVVPALAVGVVQLLARGDNSLPFGPSLAVGVLVTMLCWRWIGPQVHVLFFNGTLMIALAVVGGCSLFGISYLLRLTRGGEETEPSATHTHR